MGVAILAGSKDQEYPITLGIDCHRCDKLQDPNIYSCSLTNNMAIYLTREMTSPGQFTSRVNDIEDRI